MEDGSDFDTNVFRTVDIGPISYASMSRLSTATIGISRTRVIADGG